MKKQVLSQRELQTEEILKTTLPEYTIRANMRLVDVIRTKNQYMLGYHLDFVICDESNYAIAAVELDDRTHDTIDGQRRDANKNKWLADANIKLIRIREPEEAHQIRERIQNYTPPTTQYESQHKKMSRPLPSHSEKKYGKFVAGIATVVMLAIFVPKIMSKMNDVFVKQANENALQATKTLNALKANQTTSQVIQIGQSTPIATNMVFIRGKSLKECAPNNYINEAALRCTKDHYEPRQNGNP